MAQEKIKTDLDSTPGFRVWHGKPYTSMPPHWHDQVEINFAVGGSLTYLIAGSIVSVPPGRLSLFWAGMPHSVVSGKNIENFYWVYIPLVWILRLGLPEAVMRRVMGGEMLVDPEPMDSDLTKLDRWSEELPDADDARRRLIVREVEARVMRLALAHPEESSGAPSPAQRGPAGMVADMASFVAENHAKTLHVKDIAEHIGLHPNYAMSLFRKHYGMTLSAYLTRLRVCQAQHLLISTDFDASRIAFEVGFGSSSRFYEAFKEMSGSTPRQYRTRSQKDAVPKSPYNPCSPEFGGT